MFMPPVREFSNAIINPPSRYKRPKAPYKYRKNKYLDKGKELQRRREGPRLRPLRDVRPQPMRQYDLPAPTKRIVAKALLRGAERLGLKVVTSFNPYLRLASYAWDAYDFYYSGDDWAKTQDAGYNMSGWQKCCETNGPPYQKVRLVGGPTYVAAPPPVPCAVQSNCGLGLQVPSFDVGTAITFTVPSGTTGWYLETVFFGISQSAGTRMRLDQKWTRLVPRAPGGYIDTVPYAPAIVQPLPMYSMPPEPVISEKIEPEPLDDPHLNVPPNWPPYAVPALEFTNDPGAPKGGRIVPHRMLPPPPKTQERKRLVIKKSPGAFAGAAFGAVTEALDIVDALYKALPKEKRDRHASYQDKLIAISQNLDDIDWTDALINLLENEVKDRAAAALSKRVNKPYVDGPASKYWVRPSGVTTGHRRNYVQVQLAR